MTTEESPGYPRRDRQHHGRLRAVAFALGLLVAEWIAMRSWLINWGAAKAEARRRLPGDELVLNKSSQSTMAVTINQSPEEVWPWIVQMGIDRAGFYTYLFVENTLLRLGAVNAERIHPEWQDLGVGDHMWFVPEDYPTPRFGPFVAAIDPNRSLVLVMGKPDEPVPGTWQFVLEPGAGNVTRLLLRQHSSANAPLAIRLSNLVMEPGYFVMSRKMLLGIRERAEGRLTRAA